ncbi:hypothetical protein B2G71_23100 [Novosphingobium sp. PC22D]|nr:hypothetical protein B2G71_23100 [Novosphingobium sp. PC22D]
MPTIAAQTGIDDGTLRVVGSVVRHVSGPLKGKIHSHLQETGAWGQVASQILSSDFGGSLGKAMKTGAKLTAATGNPVVGAVNAVGDLALQATAVAQNEVIRQGVGRVENRLGTMDLKLDGLVQGMAGLQKLGIANLGLGAVGIGVSLAGFALVNAKLNQVQGTIRDLSGRVDELSAKLDQLRQERIDEDFLAIQSLARRYEEAWQIGRQSRAAAEWLSVAREARKYQDLFNHRASELLFALPPNFALADAMIDALAMTGGLRVVALMAANEPDAAAGIADENYRQIDLLTGSIGLVDLVHGHMSQDAEPGTQAWDLALTQASELARPEVTKLRQREAAAATRSAPLLFLAERGIAPKQWLEAARNEMSEPVLLLKAD